MNEVKKIYILNLVEDMGSYLSSYLSHERFVLLEREQVENYEQLDYIYCETVSVALEVAKDYDSVKNNIELMVSKPHGDYRSFILNNGRIVIDKNIIESVANKWIIDKFFSKETNIHLEDHFPELELAESIKITNHLLMGHFLDELSLNVFEKGFNLVPVRSFVDHTIYYFTYLRQAGLAGVPYEVEYGMNDEFLSINIHVSVKNFVAEYLMDSFGSVNSKDPLKYLLGVVARSCDFLDISYIENPNKLTLVGLFYKDKAGTGQGIAFNHVQTSSQVANKVEDKIKQFKSIADKKPEIEKKQTALAGQKLPGGISQSVKPFDASSALGSDDELVNKIVQFMVNRFDDTYPDLDLSDFTDYHFEEFSPFFRPEEVVRGLSPSDKENLIERIRKNNLINAYNNELDRVRDQFGHEPSMLNEVNDTLSDGIASKLGDKFSLGDINKIINSQDQQHENVEKISELAPIPVDQERNTIFGEFKPSAMSMNIDAEDSFDSIANPFEDVKLDLSNIDTGLEPQALDQISGLELPEVEEVHKFAGDGEEIDSMLVPDISSFVDDDGFALFDSAMGDSLDQRVSGFEDEDDQSQSISGTKDDPESISNIEGSFDEEEGVIKIGGGPDDPESATVVKGGKEAADDFVQKVSGLSDDDKSQFMTSFLNSFEQDVDNKNFTFKSGDKKEREDNLRRFVKSSLDKQGGLVDNGLKAFLHKEAPKEIDNALRAFAATLGKGVDELTADDLRDFQNSKLPEVMNDLLLDEGKINAFKNDLENYFVKESDDSGKNELSSFQRKFKESLEKSLNELDGVSVVDGNYTIDEAITSPSDVQNVVKDVFKQTFKEELSIGSLSPEEIKDKEKLIIKELSSMMGVPEEELKEIVNEVTQDALNKEMELVQSKLGDIQGSDELPESNEGEAILLDKVKTLSGENQSLKTQISALQLQLETEKLSSSTLNSISEEASKVSDDELIKASEEDNLTAIEKKQVMEELEKRDNIDPELASKVQKALERESELVDKLKNSEMQFKKLLLENEKKDSLFKSELTKAQKGMKAKEVVLDNAKESMKNLMEKKNKEIVGLKGQINELNHKLKDDKSQALTQQIKAVTKDNENLQRMVDIYRTKVDSLAKNMEAQKKSDSNDGLADENRNLKRLKTQLENKYQAEAKSKKSIEERFQKTKEEEVKAKNEAVNVKAELKTLQSQLKLLKDQNTKLVQSVANANKKTADGSSSKEVEQLTSRNKKLQEKLSELTKKLEQYENTDVDKSLATSKGLDEAQESRAAYFEKKSAKELELVKSQNEQLQSKIQELVDKLKKADEASNSSNRSAEDNKSTNEKRLEQSVKKLNTELSKAKEDATEQKKEAIKYKAEVNKLKNKIAALEREASKNKKKAA